MLVFGAVTVVGLLIAVLIAALVYFVATWIGVPHQIAAIIAVIVFLLVLFGDPINAHAQVEAARYWGRLRV